MKFRSRSSEPVRFPSPVGSRYRKKYVISNTPGERLLESGCEDVYDSIQKAAQGITVDDLIRRAQNGDNTAIPVPVDNYLDVSHMPTDMLSAHQMLTEARDKYNSLPANIRSKFNNSFDSFLKAAADGSVLSVLKSVEVDKATPLTSAEINSIRSMIGGSKSDA